MERDPNFIGLLWAYNEINNLYDYGNKTRSDRLQLTTPNGALCSQVQTSCEYININPSVIGYNYSLMFDKIIEELTGNLELYR